MVKFIQLKGDAVNVSKKEIRNEFREPVIIEPNSKVALVGTEVKLRNIPVQQTFIIDGTETITVDGYAVPLLAGTFDLHQLFQMLEQQIRLLGANYDTVLDHAISLFITTDGIKTTIQKFAYPEELQDFVNDWILIDGNTPSSNEFIGPGLLYSDTNIPNASYYARVTLETLDELEWGVSEITNGSLFHVIRVDALGDYQVIIDDANVLPPGTPAQAGDMLYIERDRNELKTRVLRGNTVIVDETNTVSASQVNNLFTASPFALPRFYINMPSPSVASLKNMYGTTTDVTEDTTLTIQFNSLALSDYLGWDTLGPFSDKNADPCQIVSPNRIEGGTVYPGIQVVLDPLLLDSYSGDRNHTGPQSVVYVIHDAQKFGNTIALSVPTLIPLNIKNNRPVNLNQLRAKFRNSTTGVDLEFDGNPAITLAIYSPSEDVLV